ncbi:hypothetical protein [Vibrio sp. YIC-376]|uniref:hypothetical protein n=1 Tax=Vibrio sp. YIC-376 TaxID=3136162 RepID=UPI00402A6A3F
MKNDDALLDVRIPEKKQRAFCFGRDLVELHLDIAILLHIDVRDIEKQASILISSQIELNPP